jgi:hypothetical protein
MRLGVFSNALRESALAACTAVLGMIEWRVERDGSGHPVYGDEVVWVLGALVGRRVGGTGRGER